MRASLRDAHLCDRDSADLRYIDPIYGPNTAGAAVATPGMSGHSLVWGRPWGAGAGGEGAHAFCGLTIDFRLPE